MYNRKMSKQLSISLITILVVMLLSATAQPILEAGDSHGVAEKKVDDAASGHNMTTTTTTETTEATKAKTTSSSSETTTADLTEQQSAEPAETENVESGLGFEQIFNGTQTRLKRKYSTKLNRRKSEFKPMPVTYIAPQPDYEIKRNPLIQHIVHLLNLSEQKYLNNLMKAILQEDQQKNHKSVDESIGRSKTPKQQHYNLEPEYKQATAHSSILPLLKDDFLDYDALINNGGSNTKGIGNMESSDNERISALAAATSNEHFFENEHERKNLYGHKMFFDDHYDDDNLDQKTLMELLQYIK